jgi:heme exporter protein A
MVPSPLQTPAVAVNALTKRFGSRVAVRSIEFSLGRGACLALFGPNGAGKTTLLRLLAGLLRPNTGEVRLGGVNVRGETTARARVGLISHQSMLYAPLTARENVEFFARLYGLPDAQGSALRALETMGVLDRANVAVRTLSRGLQQRVSIARAIVHEPEILLLDEPYSGLDESGSASLTVVLRSLRSRGATLVIVTHNVGEGLALATHAAIMHDGSFARFEERANAGEFDVQRYAAAYRELVGHGG